TIIVSYKDGIFEYVDTSKEYRSYSSVKRITENIASEWMFQNGKWKKKDDYHFYDSCSCRVLGISDCRTTENGYLTSARIYYYDFISLSATKLLSYPFRSWALQ